MHSVDSQDSDVTPNGSLLIQFPIVLNPEKDTQHLHPNEAATTCCIRIKRIAKTLNDAFILTLPILGTMLTPILLKTNLTVRHQLTVKTRTFEAVKSSKKSQFGDCGTFEGS